LVIIILIMMKTLQNIWKHKREFQINIFMVIGIDKFQYVELMVDFLPKETTLETVVVLRREEVRG